MRIYQKFIAFICALASLLCAIPFVVFADEAEDVAVLAVSSAEYQWEWHALVELSANTANQPSETEYTVFLQNLRYTINTGSAKFNTAIEYDTDADHTAYSRIKHYIIDGEPYSYDYDEAGNISKITNPDGSYVTYTYDALNQLTAETHSLPLEGKVSPQATDEVSYTAIAYQYDTRGNILSKTYTLEDSSTQTVSYGYTDTVWKDRLTSYNGSAITYDEIGNPLSWYNGATMSWQHGRQLASYTKDGTTVLYTYDDNGIRTSKTVNGTTTSYTVVDGTLRRMTDGINTLQFINGTSVIFNGVEYWYVFNAQNDVIGLIDANGDYVVEYTYDSWGKPLSKTGTMADTLGTLNPFRYRGYIYDEETGFYYVSSRYYDPAIGRWLNTDSEIAGVGGEALGYNAFAYCFNNPVNMDDPSGNWPKWLSGVAKAVSGVMQIAAGAALGATVGWTGVGAVAAAALMINGAATVGQGVGKIYNAVTKTKTFAEDNVLRSGAQSVGRKIGGDTGAAIGGALYDVAIATASLYGSAYSIANQVPSTPMSACFISGTVISTGRGYIAIENIRAGDLVWSENPETGEKALKEVVQTFINKTTELVYVYVDGEEIVTTPEHPFYIPQKGWTTAIQLRAGDILIMQNGKYVVIEKIQHEILESPITVYNFEVADFHTYYVSENAILVHNVCKPTTANQMQMQVNRGQAPETVIRVDAATPYAKAHVHFSDGTSLNIDGTVHDAVNGVHVLTNKERIWLFENGWGG